MGHVQKVWQVKSVQRSNSVQDAGVVTLLVKYLLEEGRVDSALLTRRQKDWCPVPFLATGLEEVEQASGTKFTVSPTLACLKEGISRFSRLAVVGLPCQIAAIENFRRWEQGLPNKGNVVFTIGLFCTNSFIYGTPFSRGMKDVVERDLGIPIEEVDKFEIKKGKLRVYRAAGSTAPVVRSIKTLETLIWPTCLSCADFTSTFSDISVGSIGSENLTNTVIVRTNKGNRIFEGLRKKGLVEAHELKDLSEIKRIVKFKRVRRERHCPEAKTFLDKAMVLGNWLDHLDRCPKEFDLP